jgi:hypothetical protein
VYKKSHFDENKVLKLVKKLCGLFDPTRPGPLTLGLNSAQPKTARANFGRPEFGPAWSRAGPFRDECARARPEPCQKKPKPGRAGLGTTLKKAAYTFKGFRFLNLMYFLIKKINTVFIENIAFLAFFLTKNKYVYFIVKK